MQSKFLFSLLPIVIIGCAAPVTSKVVGTTEHMATTQPTLEDLVVFHQARVKRDPQGAIGWAMLAEANLAVARAHDDDKAAAAAEVAAKESLKVREVGNSRAALRLTEAYLAQHKFVDAEGSARLAFKLSGESSSTERMLGDVLLELGKYNDFKALISSHKDLASSPDGAATLARWNEVIGQPATSMSLLKNAVKVVEGSGTANTVAAGWYRNQLAFAYLRNHENGVAEKLFDMTLASEPNNHKALFGKAKIAFEAGENEAVVELCDKALAQAKLTDTFGLKALAVKRMGNQAEFTKLSDQLFEMNGSPADSHGAMPEGRHTHSRLYAAFLVQSGTKLRLAHHMTEEDLQWRKDIHAYDAFAWATYNYWKNDPSAKKAEGNVLLKEAVTAIKRACVMGTKDPEIRAHEAAIMESARAEGLLK